MSTATNFSLMTENSNKKEIIYQNNEIIDKIKRNKNQFILNTLSQNDPYSVKTYSLRLHNMYGNNFGIKEEIKLLETLKKDYILEDKSIKN